VIYMGAGDAARVRDALLEAGVPPGMPAALVENASLEDSSSVRGTVAGLEALSATRGSGPAVILLGRVLAVASEAELSETIASALAA
jgi:uroporphyrin-III C-methyltransferase